MPYCVKCGSKVNEGQNFCGICGTPLPNTTNANKKDDIKKGKAMSILAYFGITFFLPLVVCPESKFGRFHANQGLLLLITEVLLGIINAVIQGIVLSAFNIKSIMGGFSGSLFISTAILEIIDLVIGLIILALLIIGMINAANEKEKELPVIGRFRLIRNL